MYRYIRNIISGLLIFFIISCVHHLPSYHYVDRYQYHISVPIKIIPIYIDNDFGNGDLLEIDNAIKQWNYALNGYIDLEVVTTKFMMESDIIKSVQRGEGWLILKISSDSPLIHEKSNEQTLAFCNAIGGYALFVIRDRIGNEDMTGVMLHEIGHLLGARHTSYGLMYSIYSPDLYQCIDLPAITGVSLYQGIPEGRMNFCLPGEVN